MSEEQFNRIKGYVATINVAADSADNSTIVDFTLNEVYDRVLIYLNDNTLNKDLERVVARIVSGVFNQTINSKDSTQSDSAISSVSDNGQSVSFTNEVKNYLATTEDNELFAGFSKLLARYRRINVVS